VFDDEGSAKAYALRYGQMLVVGHFKDLPPCRHRRAVQRGAFDFSTRRGATVGYLPHPNEIALT
jgi:hypothetical protein